MMCKCVIRHTPEPVDLLTRQVNDGTVCLCPTSAHNLDVLLRLYEQRAGSVPGSLTKHFSKYINDLAKDIYFKD